MIQLSTQNYKGARDFYPEDMRLQRYIFDTWRRVSERYGYEEYSAPLLEPTDLYRAKSGEEIVNEQTYSFTDRGGRDVTIRPEMTPSLARMVAARTQSLAFPLRWYSIPNVWRYERPQHGRLREHWQLNVDLFGVDDVAAEFEVIRLAHDIMRAFGADDTMFMIKLNSRELMSYLFGEYLGLSVEAAQRLGKLLDRKNKMGEEAFVNQADAILKDNLNSFLELMKATRLQDLPEPLRESQPAVALREVARRLHAHQITNIQFDLTIQRGLDYYTGIVFEIFDTNPENSRSLFGGGRYDDLLSVFQAPAIPAVGFGMGDVGIENFLRGHNLIPRIHSPIHVAVVSVDKSAADAAERLATRLRADGLNTIVDVTERKIGTKVKAASQRGIHYVVTVGEQEIESQRYPLKQLHDGTTQQLDAEGVIAHVRQTVLE